MNLQQTNPKIIPKEPITKQYYNEIRHYEPLTYDEERILLISRYDNLGKGASGAAVQCLNIMMGIDEATGLNI